MRVTCCHKSQTIHKRGNIKIQQIVSRGAVGLLLSAHPLFGIEQLGISLQSSNAVVSWPSRANETYIVQYRPAFDTNTPWVTLTNNLAAAANTNWTSFVHTGAVTYPDCPAGEGGGSGGGPPTPGNARAALVVESLSMNVSIWDKWIFENREPLLWELEKRPPLPWDEDFIQSRLTSRSFVSRNSLSLENEESICPPTMGFYRVVRDGVYVVGLTNLTNATLSGSFNLAFEAGNAVGLLDNAVVLADGGRFAGANVLSVPITAPWQFTVDTAFLENGVHTLQVQVTWQNPDTTNGNEVFISRRSATFSIWVSNHVYYPQWEPAVGEANISAYFAKTTSLNTNWQIDIYDVSSNLVKTLTGQTTDGTITAYWNLVDLNGALRTNATVDPQFNSIITAGATAKATPPKKQKKKDWPAQGRWVVAFQDFFKFEYSEDGDMQGSINDFALTAGKYGGYVLYYPPPGSTNDIGQTYPLRYQKANHFDTNITPIARAMDAIMLINFLANTNSRNFYYNGHGSESSIANLNIPSLVALIKHRYRFVFLDGCSTANGRLDEIFGIHGPGRFALSYYQSTGIRPGAFVGYDANVPYAKAPAITVGGVTYDDQIPWQVPYFIYNFLFYWDEDLLGWALNDALEQAADDLPPVTGFSIQPGRHLQIFGFDDLRINDFNYRADWP